MLLLGALAGLLAGGCTREPAAGSCRTVLNCKDDAAPICDAASLLCRSCTPSTDDVACKNRNAKTPRCGQAGRCVGCLSSDDCKGTSTPICGDNNTCTGCQLASDCASKVCRSDHSCAPSNEVIFVDNKNAPCSSGTHSGAPDDPFCSIQDAVTAATNSGKALISVAPSARPYDAVNVSGVSAAGLYIASSSDVAGSVLIRSTSNTDAVALSGSGSVKVILSGIDASSPSANGINCMGGVDLTVTRSRIHDSQNGIVAANCQLTLDGVRIHQNKNNGIYLSASMTMPYSINNVMVWSNGGSGLALVAPTGILRFVTIYANGTPTLLQPPGIDCGSGQNLVENSIVFNNISALSANLLDKQTVGCTLMNVVTNDMKSGTYKSQIDFVNALGGDPSAYDLRLKADSVANADCCIDKVTQGMGLVDHDIDLLRRPMGSGWDYGASEVMK